MVEQKPYIFDAKVRENVRYGRLDATDEEVEAACKSASLHDNITQFSEGRFVQGFIE